MGTCKIVGWCDNPKCFDGCLARKAANAESDECAEIFDIRRIADAVLRVEHNYMTLRTPSGWLLWRQKVTDESYLETVLKTATENLLSGFPE